MRVVSALLGALLAALAPAAVAQPAGVEKIASHRLDAAIDPNSARLVDGKIVAVVRQPCPGCDRLPLQLVEIDPVSGKVIRHGEPDRSFGMPLFFTQTHILAQSDRGGDLFLYSRNPIEEVSRIRLRWRVLGMIERDGEIQLLQWSRQRGHHRAVLGARPDLSGRDSAGGFGGRRSAGVPSWWRHRHLVRPRLPAGT